MLARPMFHSRTALTRPSGALALALALPLAFALGGCATKASRQASGATRKDLTVLQPGTAREVVLDELGTPLSSTTSRAGNAVDIFTFVQGTKPSGKPPRPVEPEQAESREWMQLLGQGGKSPLGYFDGKELTVQVNYDAGLRVENTVMLRVE